VHCAQCTFIYNTFYVVDKSDFSEDL